MKHDMDQQRIGIVVLVLAFATKSNEMFSFRKSVDDGKQAADILSSTIVNLVENAVKVKEMQVWYIFSSKKSFCA